MQLHSIIRRIIQTLILFIVIQCIGSINMTVGNSADLVWFTLQIFAGACNLTKVRWALGQRDGIQNQIQNVQPGQCNAGIYHLLLLFNRFLQKRLLVKCYSSSRERGAKNLQNSWRELRDLCPVIGHLLVSRSQWKLLNSWGAWQLEAWIADQGRTMDCSFVGSNPPSLGHLS